MGSPVNLRLVSSRAPYRRGGQAFDHAANRSYGLVKVALADVTEDQLAELLADPHVDVTCGSDYLGYRPVEDMAGIGIALCFVGAFQPEARNFDEGRFATETGRDSGGTEGDEFRTYAEHLKAPGGSSVTLDGVAIGNLTSVSLGAPLTGVSEATTALITAAKSPAGATIKVGGPPAKPKAPVKPKPAAKAKPAARAKAAPAPADQAPADATEHQQV